MAIETVYWEAAKTPSDLALGNLNKLVSTMITKNYIGPNNIVTALRLAKEANVAYNSTLKLLDKPGFVKVEGDATGWYWLTDFGSTYPSVFPNTFKIPRKIIITQVAQPQSLLTGNSEADKTIRSQIKPEALLESNQRIITLPGMDRTTPTTRNNLIQMFTVMTDSMIKLESPPERYASAIYEVAEAIHNGVLKVTQE